MTSGADRQTARDVAADVIGTINPRRQYAASLLEDRLACLGHAARRRHATDLVFGTLRNRLAVDTVTTAFSGRPVERIHPRLLGIIRVGAYELIYCPSSPDYAVVDEAVRIAADHGGSRFAGFVNAVLRQIARHIIARRAEISSCDPRRTLPQDESFGCLFDADLLPAPTDDPAGYLGKAFSMPHWLVAAWLKDYGPRQAQMNCLAANRRPCTYLRANTLKITAHKLASALAADGVAVEPVDQFMVKIRGWSAVDQLPLFADGFFSAQDLTASMAARLLKPRKDWRILDLCAAPGTKTCQIAEITGDRADITATDIDAVRLKLVRAGVERLGLRCVKVVDWDDVPAGPYDCIMLDVPCSNTGVLARRPEVRYRINKRAICSLARAQVSLLDRASQMLAADGRICYSTCSIQNQENSDLISMWLKGKSFILEAQQLTLASLVENCDGAYTAVLKKEH